MENIAAAGPSMKHDSDDENPGWLNTLLQDSIREAEDARIMGKGLVGETGRAIVWTMCAKFGCDKIGVPGQTCRLFEGYLANLMRTKFAVQEDLWNYIIPRLIITLACCFQIATKSTSTKARVCPKAIRAYLASCGIAHTNAEIMTTEREIFRSIGFRVPLYNSVEMAELLADHVNVEHTALETIAMFVNLAELKRHDIEDEVRWVAGLSRMPYCNPRVRTLHLAAGCVAATIKKANLTTPTNTEDHLARIIGVNICYLKVLRDAILLWVISPKPPTPKPHHIPYNFRNKRYSADGRGPGPSTSKS